VLRKPAVYAVRNLLWHSNRATTFEYYCILGCDFV